MNLISSTSAMAFVVYMFFGIYVFKLNKKAYLNKLFLVFCLCFAIWSFGDIYLYAIDYVFPKWILTKLAAIGWCTYYGVALHIALVLSGKLKFIKNKKHVVILYIPSILMLLANIFIFRYGIKNSAYSYYIYSWFAFVISTSYIATCFVIIYLWGRKTKIDKEKKQAKVILRSGLFCYLLGMLFEELSPILNTGTAPVGQILGIIWVSGIYYAIANYKFMEISSYAAEQIVSKIKDIIILLDTNMNIIYGNQQIINVLGYTEEELAGRRYSYIFKYGFELTGEKCETICITKDGLDVPVEVMATPVFDNDNDFIGTLLIINDISEAKKLNREIVQVRQAEASLKNLLNSSKQGFLTIGEDLKINKEYSIVCRTIFKEKLIDRYLPEVLYAEEKQERTFFIKIVKAIFDEIDFSKVSAYFSLLPSCVVINKRYVNLEYKMLGKEKDDKKLMVILTDVTTEINLKKQIEESLLKNETCFNLLIQNSRDAIFVHRDGKLIFANESVAKLLGFINPEDFSGKSIFDLSPVDVRSFISEKFNKVYEEKINLMSFNGKVLKSDGKVIDVENTSTYFIYNGKPTILSILRDITPEKQIEKLQKDVEKNIKLLNETRELNKLITEFFSNISHELKTPLNVIFAGVQTLNLYNNNFEGNVQKRSKYLCMMKQNCYRLIKLINNLIDVTKIDSGFVRLNLQNNDIVNVIEEVSLSVVPYLESKGISLIFDTDVEEKIMACDADKIERIILNLISNSMKFTNPGGEICVNFMDFNDKISFSVKDTGVGIPEDKLNIIFDRFGQVDKTLRRNREGSGLGLSLVKSFVEMHGGNIQVKSKLGEGSEFIVELPVSSLEECARDESTYEIDSERINIEFSDVYLGSK